ncbi:gamma-glutamyltranspeptidase / glutathione hydrolase [Nitrosomonas aestuarii]|uniref:Gamma-glutamyltranspeptidase / glutathione hydrolase n=1 Tax=Nitrosomonas aestuarii TaxID=52441 RepID=A0A1I4GQR0_9PROT|nr:gamma-glutamyltransferase [Nitrosomonas aestuarii]SFL31840.1 gamma-glutamyltranspeptidase / glutathione hydrolase [Nitrosomonas aestuarii]
MKLDKIEGCFVPSEDGKCAVAQNGMVSTAFPEATEAGVEMLRRGGNAVDAACAAAFALGVCEPQASGLGGQSHAMLHFQGKTVAIDGSSRVPSLAHLDQISDNKELIKGYRATTVPSTPAVLGYLHFRYGSLDWSEILEPAIQIASGGYAITPLQHQLQQRELKKFLGAPGRSGAHYFLKDSVRPYDAGDIFKQPDLTRLLEKIAWHGIKAFYTGVVAEQIDEDMRQYDGFLRAEDLAYIPWPVERRPLHRNYRSVRVFTCPPPSAGRTLLLTLQILKNLPARFLLERDPKSFHFIAEAFRKALLNHKERPFDPNVYPQLPDDKKLLSSIYAKRLSASIRDVIDPDLPLHDLYPAQSDTTHLSVMDNQGNAIGITQSIELVYGSKVAAAGLGFLYNNYMSSLEFKDPSHPYYLRPNARPWSSVAPIICFYKDKLWMVAGSPGSERIFSTMSQFLTHMIDGDMPMSTAMIHPRFHCSVGGTLSIEADRFPVEVLDYLQSVGYKMDLREPYSFYLGAVHAVLKCQTNELFHGVAEIRRDGFAAGL